MVLLLKADGCTFLEGVALGAWNRWRSQASWVDEGVMILDGVRLPEGRRVHRTRGSAPLSMSVHPMSMGPQNKLPTLAETEVRFRAEYPVGSPKLVRLERTLADFYTALQKRELVA